MPHATCTVCTHEAHAEIDSLLLSGGSVRAVAKRFGLSSAAVHRHQHHDEYVQTRTNTDEIRRIKREIRKLHHAEAAARKRRDNAGALAISRELRNWHILKQKAELALIGATSESASEQLSPRDAVLLAKSVIESQLDDPDVRAWLSALHEQVGATGKLPDVQE